MKMKSCKSAVKITFLVGAGCRFTTTAKTKEVPMFITFGKRMLTVGLLTAVAWATFPSNASAGHAWSNYHWARTNNPFTLKLVAKLTSTWVPYLYLASAAWTTASKLNTTILTGASDAASRQACATVAGRTVVCNYPYGATDWLGLATIWIDKSSTLHRAEP
jgi:hypothetical protein